MKAIAQEDYVIMINQVASNHDGLDFCNWAKNMQLNEYLPLYNATSNEYWRWLAEKEHKETIRDKAAGIIGPSVTMKSSVKQPKANPFTAKDALLIDGYRESFGTIVDRSSRSYTSKDNKGSYFKTLGMNNIMDISDNTENSHLAQLDEDGQKNILNLLSTNKQAEKIDQDDDHHLETIIKKFRNIEDDDKFLEKTIKEIDDSQKVDKVVKRVYLQILETMKYDSYLYETENGNSEADFIIKIYSPILENVFRGSGCRLAWGETKSPSCVKVSNRSKLDLRIITQYTKSTGLALSEFAKRPAPWKYYYDKKKAVIVSLIHLKEHIKNANLNLEEAKRFMVPFILSEGLESNIYTIRLVSEDWTVVEKLKDIDLPTCVQDVRDGKIENYMQTLKDFKNMCIELKNNVQKKRCTTKGMHRISKKQPIVPNLLAKPMYVDPFTDTSEEEDEVVEDDEE